MPGPFVAALTALPWPTILKQAPALLAAADALIARSRRPVAPTAATDLEALRQRIAELEAQQQADVELVKQLAAQLTAIAVAAEATSVRVRQCFVLAAAGVALGLIACLLLWLRWN
jgi:hypothetical protein